MTEEAKERKREYSKEKYHFYKSKGICVVCGQEKAAKGRVKCLNCLDNESVGYYVRSSKWTDEERAAINLKHSIKAKERYQKRKQAGLCPRCGKYKPESGYVQCKYCRVKDAQRVEKTQRKKGVLPISLRGNGSYCAICCGEVHGEKVCESCRQKLLKNLEKANQASKNSTNKHSWHSTNKKLFNGDKNAN